MWGARTGAAGALCRHLPDFPSLGRRSSTPAARAAFPEGRGADAGGADAEQSLLLGVLGPSGSWSSALSRARTQPGGASDQAPQGEGPFPWNGWQTFPGRPVKGRARGWADGQTDRARGERQRRAGAAGPPLPGPGLEQRCQQHIRLQHGPG